ncbi:tRNA threonylcarbamoyladenosine dehydratase, partial [Vibrio fujianensis]
MRELETPASDSYNQRFGGTRRLYGHSEVEILRAAHVCVIGIGGVGSWAVEALARSGIGALTLIDMDDVCVTNINRQIHAMNGTVGQSKIEVMADRVQR